ncbi:dipeptidase [Filimonas lacunae]|nr:dipeptidase [Filimonas lacunae]
MTGAGAALALSPLASWTLEEADPKVAAIVAKTMGIDTHNHVDVPLTTAELPGPAVDLAGEMKKSGLSAICMTFAVDYQKLVNPGDGYERFLNGLTAMDKVLESNRMKRALNMADLRNAHQKHQPVVIQSVEGGHFLEGHIERLEVAYQRGLRHLTLLHDNDASVPLGDVYTNKPQWGGLTAFGAEVIKECNRMGILVDMAHANLETVAAAVKIAQYPVLVSHTGLDTQLGKNEMMAKMMKPRLISKEQAKIIADAGGVIGVWTHLADTPLEFAQNVRALVDVIGVDHVSIGTDTKMTPSYRPAGGFGQKPGGAGPQQNGGAQPGGIPPGGDSAKRHDGPPRDNGHGGPGAGGPGGGNRRRAGERTNEAWEGQQVGFYYAVVDAMLKVGFNEAEIGKIGGGNFCRLFEAATKGHQ